MRVTNSIQEESEQVLEKLKHYVYPANPLDERLIARWKRGAIHYAQVDSWWPLAGVQRWIRGHRFEFRCGRNGQTTRVAVSGADLTHLWVADELLVEGVYRLDAVPFTPDLVLDLGANIGLFTLMAAHRWPQASLVCVEPHPTTFSFLCDNLARNNVNAIKLQCALDADVGVKFMENDGAVYQALSRRPTETQVMTLRLDSLIPRQPDLKLLIKMDIEGSEPAVLDDLETKLPEQTFFFIELHDGEKSLRWIRAWAQRRNFVFQEVRRREVWIDGYLARPAASTAMAAHPVDVYQTLAN